MGSGSDDRRTRLCGRGGKGFVRERTQNRHHGRVLAAAAAFACHLSHVSRMAPAFALSSCPVCRSAKAIHSPTVLSAGSAAPVIGRSSPDAFTRSPHGSMVVACLRQSGESTHEGPLLVRWGVGNSRLDVKRIPHPSTASRRTRGALILRCRVMSFCIKIGKGTLTGMCDTDGVHAPLCAGCRSLGQIRACIAHPRTVASKLDGCGPPLRWHATARTAGTTDEHK